MLLTSTSVPALMVAAVVHADLVAAAPFASHNGIVARAAERLVLVARGVDEKSLVVPEAGHLALRAAYESNLRGYRDGGQAGVHAWLLYAAEAYAAGAEASPLRTRRRARTARPIDPGRHCSGMRAAPDSRPIRMPPLTREPLATKRAVISCCPGSFPNGRRPVGRVDRRVGTRLTCGFLELCSRCTPHPVATSRLDFSGC